MDWIDYTKLGFSALLFLYSLITTLIAIIKAKKAKDNEELKKLLTEELIPLMEEAERAFEDGADREEWVIKKLADKLHIDLFKYKKVLALIKEIIASICDTTKIQVNNIRVVQEKTKGSNNNGKELY